MLLVERETVCKNGVTNAFMDKDFDFHAVKGWESPFGAVLWLERTLYMAPYQHFIDNLFTFK